MSHRHSQNITESADTTPWYQSFLFFPFWAIDNWQVSYLHHLHESSLSVYLCNRVWEEMLQGWRERYKMMEMHQTIHSNDLPNSCNLTLNLGSFLYRHWSSINPAWGGINAACWECMKSTKDQPQWCDWWTIPQDPHRCCSEATLTQPNRNMTGLNYRRDLSRNHDFTRSSIQIERRHSLCVQRRPDALSLGKST